MEFPPINSPAGKFHAGGISRLARARQVITSPRMTRKSIEASVKIFLVALVITFVWTVTKVLAMLGWM
jgi:hypothetical protein